MRVVDSIGKRAMIKSNRVQGAGEHLPLFGIHAQTKPVV